MTVPTMMVHAADDATRSVASTAALLAALPSSTKALHTMPCGSHFSLFDSPVAGDGDAREVAAPHADEIVRVAEAIARFLHQSL